MRKIIFMLIILFAFMRGEPLCWDIESFHKDILYPTVRVRTEGSSGSGIVFASIPQKELNKATILPFDTYILTNHHVIESAIKISEQWNPLLKKMEKKETRATIEVEIFKYQHLSQATGTLLIQADIMEWNDMHDLAILKLRSDEKIDSVLKFPKDKENTLKIFEPVFICGAGLGRPPFPTLGVLASLRDEIDNLSYWMVTAPSVFGNSGGGAFICGTREFFGMPSRLAVTFAQWAPNAVYHMSYIIPISRIYKWLDETGWSCLYDTQAKSHDEWLKEKKREAKDERNEK